MAPGMADRSRGDQESVQEVCASFKQIIMALEPSLPVGIFDSGVGGISVLRAIREQLPEESIVYFGDQGHVPYGSRSMEQIQRFSEAITRFLLKRGAKIV